MKNLLTTRIISALNKKDILLISDYLKQEKRKSLFKLFQLLLNERENIKLDRAKIFQKLFKQKLTKSNDYLLRNELKLLKDKMEDAYIANKTAETMLRQKNNLKLEWYRHLKITDEYTEILNTQYEFNKQHFRHDNTLYNSFIYADFIRINTSNYAERLRLMQENLSHFETTFHQYITEQYSIWCLMKSHVLLQQKQMDNTHKTASFRHETLHIKTEDYRNYLTEYYLAYANAYCNFDTSTIAEWENIYALLLKNPDNEIIESEKCYTLGNLATICSIRNQFEKADFYFSELFNSLPEAITSQNMALTFNYITNLNKLKFHELARAKMQNAIVVFGNKIKTFSQFRTQQIVAACYLVNTKELGSLLAVDFETLQPFERIFYRLFYCIYFIQLEDFELAFTEIQNLQRSKLMKEIDTHYELIADYFYVSIKHGLSVGGNYSKCSTKAIKEIESANERIIKSGVPILQNYSPYQWMKERVNS